MIRNNIELEATLERIERLQRQVERLQEIEISPRNYELSAGGFLAEIDRMNLEVQHYLASNMFMDNMFMDMNQLRGYVDSERFNLWRAAGKPTTSDDPLIISTQVPDEVAVYDAELDEDQVAEVMKGLAQKFHVGELVKQLTVTW